MPELNAFLSHIKVDTLFLDCPDITATYLEVLNAIWLSESTSNNPSFSIDISMPRNAGSALLKIQKAIYDVHRLSTHDDAVSKLKSLLQSREIGLDGLVAALETLPKVWRPSSCSQETLAALCSLYVDVCQETNYSEAQVLSVENLADVLDKLLEQKSFDLIPKDALVSLWMSLPSRPMNPALSNAVIRASGPITAALSDPKQPTSVNIHAWGLIMADAALDDKVNSSPLFKLSRPSHSMY